MLIPLQIPAGVYKNGTELQGAGRWSDSNLVRWYQNTMRPVGGWWVRSTQTVSGVARGITTWNDNNAFPWIAIGTHSGLYAVRVDGAIGDITPVGYTTGIVDAVSKTGYGYSFYGVQAYGVERLSLATITPATTWSMDTWGEYLIACANSDGKIYEWDLSFSPAISPAAQLANSPTNCSAVMVTSDRIIFALGANGNPRLVKWCDQENNTVWAPNVDNQAGDFELVTAGNLMAGQRVRGINLLWTNIDVHSASYIGQPFIYSFEKIGSGCGLIAPLAVTVVSDAMAFWMSKSGFWMYDGYVKPLPSDVGDYVYRDMNPDQVSKTFAFHNSQFGEVWWLYAGEASTEVNKYVTYNYRENHWAVGSLERTTGIGRGAFDKPLMVSVDGVVYEHEAGLNHSGAQVFAESGPIQIGTGDNIMVVKGVVPDEETQGDVRAVFKTKFYPNAEERSYGPYTMANPTSTRFTARQVKMRIEEVEQSDWRVGTMRLDATQGGRR